MFDENSVPSCFNAIRVASEEFSSRTPAQSSKACRMWPRAIGMEVVASGGGENVLLVLEDTLLRAFCDDILLVRCSMVIKQESENF